jgi:hypothetical protein
MKRTSEARGVELGATKYRMDMVNMSDAITQIKTPKTRCRAASRSGCGASQTPTRTNPPMRTANRAMTGMSVSMLIGLYPLSLP